MNAKVEAARAGKYGKGFAVVADELRNLAVRGGATVKETTAIVEGTTSNMNGEAIAAEDLGEIAVAGIEQAQGVEQINSGLDQIDQVTQSNTANAEESASAAEELAAQAEQIQGMISRFKIESKEST